MSKKKEIKKIKTENCQISTPAGLVIMPLILNKLRNVTVVPITVVDGLEESLKKMTLIHLTKRHKNEMRSLLFHLMVQTKPNQLCIMIK